jgi:hypothetical protein
MAKDYDGLGLKNVAGVAKNGMKANESYTMRGPVDINKSKQTSMQTNKNKSAQGLGGLKMGGHLWGTHHGAHKKG